MLGELPNVPEKTGYTGVWTINGNEISADYVIEDDVTVTAVYTIKTFTVTFETGEPNVTMPDNLTLDYGTKLLEKLGNVPDKTGYTGKWTINGAEISADYVIEEDITVTAVYTINRYTVTFDSNETVDLPESLTLDYGTTLLGELPNVPEKTGYTGVWTINGEEIPANYTIEEDVTVTAVYTIKTFTVTFETAEDNVTMPDNLTLEYGANLPENLQNVEVPHKAFYTGKWTIDGAEVPADKTVDSDITITAVYTHIKVNVSFKYVGGYSDNEGVTDLQNFKLNSLAELSFDYDISEEEFYQSISEYLSQVPGYTVGKTVYLRPSEMPQNILDISTLPEFTASTLLGDCAEDIVTDGEEVSQLAICFLPDWTIHTVTFDDDDEYRILDGMSFASLGMEMPKTTNDSVWIYLNENEEYDEFYEQTSIYENTNIYSGYRVSSYGFANGVWQTDSFYGMIYKKAGDTLTDADLSYLAAGEIIAGFISEPITDPLQKCDFVEAGTVINANTDLYAVKGMFNYTDANKKPGTVYWLGDGFSPDLLPNVEDVGYKWHFVDGEEIGEEFNENTFWTKYDELLNSNPAYNAARFTIVAVKDYDYTVTYHSSDGSETVYYFKEGETLSENSRYTYDELPDGTWIYDTGGLFENSAYISPGYEVSVEGINYPQYEMLFFNMPIKQDYIVYEGISLTINARAGSNYYTVEFDLKKGDAIPDGIIEAIEAKAGRHFIAYNTSWNYADQDNGNGEMNAPNYLDGFMPDNEYESLTIYLLTHIFQYTDPDGKTVYFAVDVEQSDDFVNNVDGHAGIYTGTWYYKKEEEWIEITEGLTISSVFPDSCLVEVKLVPNS